MLSFSGLSTVSTFPSIYIFSLSVFMYKFVRIFIYLSVWWYISLSLSASISDSIYIRNLFIKHCLYSIYLPIRLYCISAIRISTYQTLSSYLSDYIYVFTFIYIYLYIVLCIFLSIFLHKYIYLTLSLYLSYLATPWLNPRSSSHCTVEREGWITAAKAIRDAFLHWVRRGVITAKHFRTYFRKGRMFL